MTTYKQIDEDTIQFFRTNENGSISNGDIARGGTRTRQIQDGTEQVKIGTEEVQTGTQSTLSGTEEVQTGVESISIGFDEEGVELFGDQPVFTTQDIFIDEPVYETQDIFETQPKFIDETFSPWDELDPTLVTWLDVPAWQAQQDAEAALQAFKATRQALVNTATVDANGFLFDADEIAIGRMANAILAAILEADTYPMKWSLADTATGVMTDVTLVDVKLAQKLAVLKMANIWGV